MKRPLLITFAIAFSLWSCAEHSPTNSGADAAPGAQVDATTGASDAGSSADAEQEDTEDGEASDAVTANDTGSTDTSGPDGGTLDGGTPDSGTPDGGMPDVGAPDVGTPDSGAPDVGTPDVGTPDSGTPDVGTPDGGTPDGGTPDSGTPDVGTPDGGTPDVGTPDGGMPDGGTLDTGTPDSGVCERDCEGRSCGPDGCGGSCGGCAGEETCDEERGVCEAPPVECPPAGPFGRAIGDILQDVSVPLCDGSMYSVHDLCGFDGAAIITFADWCPTCRNKAPTLQREYEERADEDFEMLFIVTQDTSFQSATSALCEAVQERYGLTMPVAYDQGAVFRAATGAPSNDGAIVLDEGMEIVETRQYLSAGAIFSAVDDALGD